MTSEKINKIAFWLLLLVQCVYMIFWGTQKSGYYVDEFFTYDNAHYISASTPERVKLYDVDYLEYNKWLKVTDIKSTLTVTKENALFNDSLKDNIVAILKSPYSVILNYVETIFFEGELNWWSALSINLVCFLLNQILIYQIVMKISKNQISALISMALYGFCGMAISMFVYVRMYMWLTFLVSLFTFLHVMMWYEQTWWKNVIYEILAMVVLLLAYKNSPLPVLYGVALIVCLTIGLIVKKRWGQIGYYSIPIMLGGFAYATLETKYIEVFKNPELALENGSLGAAESSLVNAFVSLNAAEFISRAEDLIHMVSRYLFGHFFVIVIYLLLLVCGIMLFLKERKEIQKKVLYEEQQIYFIILGAVVAFSLASIAFGLSSIRYNSFVFPEVAICVVGIISCLYRIAKKERLLVVICSIIIVGQIFYTGSIPRIENLYLEDREEIEAIQQCKGVDSLVVDYHFDDKVMYECLAYTDEDTRVMFTQYGNTDFSKLTDTLLVWQSANESDYAIQELSNSGFSCIEEIANTHESRVFLCKKQ